MKKILYLFLLFLPILGFAQSRYGVEGVPVCWRTPLGVDSSLNRYVVISTTGKPVQTIVYENAAGSVVTVAGGTMRYGYCDCIDYTVPDSSITWAMLTEPVKDSIRFARKDTTVLVLSGNTAVDFDFSDTRRFSNVYFVGKGVTDTAQVVFLSPPGYEQFGTVFHVKADSGDVAVRFSGSQGVNNKNFYLLQPGQRAEVRALYDAVASSELWEVVIVWDSIGGGGGNGIYGGSDSLSQTDTYAAMAADGSQSFALGYFQDGVAGWTYGRDYGLVVDLLNNGYVGFGSKYTGIYSYDEVGGGFNTLDAVAPSGSVSSRVFQDGASRLFTGYVVNKRDERSQVFGLDTLGFFITTNSGDNNETVNPKLRFPDLLTSAPSTTPGAVNILKWTAGMPSFGPRYESDTLPNLTTILKMPTWATLGDHSFAIGSWPTFPDYTNNQNRYGLYISPNYWGSNILAYYYNNQGTELIQSAGNIRLSRLRGSTEISYVGVSGDSPAMYARNRVGAEEGIYFYADSTGIWAAGVTGGSSLGGYKVIPNTSKPSVTSGAISNHIWTAGTPSFLRSQHKVVSGTTDGIGDLLVTFDATMPDVSYTMLVTVEGDTFATAQVRPSTKATGSCKVRFFDAAGAALTSTAVQISYEVKDTN